LKQQAQGKSSTKPQRIVKFSLLITDFGFKELEFTGIFFEF
jgi:hypothetical protein